MKRLLVVLIPGILALGLAVRVPAEQQQHGPSAVSEAPQDLRATATTHVTVRPDELKWVDAPPAMPKGAKIAILEGDPAKPAPFTFRLKLPDGYRVAPHFHPADENDTVISGTLLIGFGDKFDPAAMSRLGPGSYAVTPKGHHHFVAASGETIFQVSAIGPWGYTYVNPADDPRGRKEARK